MDWVKCNCVCFHLGLTYIMTSLLWPDLTFPLFIAVCRNDLRRKSGEFCSLSFTKVHHSRRFSSQMCSQQHRNLMSEVTYYFHCEDHVFVYVSINTSVGTNHQNLLRAWFCFFIWRFFLFLSVFLNFWVCCLSETPSTRPLACGESCRGSSAAF